MSKIKIGFLVLSVLFLSTSIKAQGIKEGKTFYYYEKFKSAKSVFGNIVAAKPNDIDAVYWLGQAEIELGNVEDAKSLYQKTLLQNPNSPLLIAGMGHVELLEGKYQDARNRFETAISLSKGKDADVLNAIGYANIEVQNGDATYAVDKLTQASETKKMKNPDVFVNLGDAYRKAGDGGGADGAYKAALQLDENYVRAYYRLAKMYETQGVGQEDIYLEYYDKAIEKDGQYAPAYYALYNYYYSTNVGKSAAYLDKYLAIKGDDEPNACYYRASMKYAQGLFQDAINESDACISGSSLPYYKLYRLKAYAFNRLGDSLNAKNTFEAYFAKQKPEDIESNDYITYAKVLLKFPQSDSLADVYIEKGIALDSVNASKVASLKEIALYYEGAHKYAQAAKWYDKILSVKKNASNVDIYNAGYNYYRIGKYENAITTFNLYSQKYPDDAFGYYMAGKSYWGIDSTMQQGLANPSFEKAIQVGAVDSVKFKPQLIGSYKYFVAYYANIKKDKTQAIAYCDKILALDPTDSDALANKEAIKKIVFK